MREFLNSNTAYKVMSLLIAAGLWLYINIQQNPTADTVLTVPLETRELPSSYMLSEKPAIVEVRVQGRKEIVSGLNSREVVAYVDLRSAKLGINSLPVEVKLPLGVQLVAVTPQRVEVQVDETGKVQLPVSVQVVGRLSAGYRALEPVVEPSEVVVSGPKRILADISEVYVEVRYQGSEPSEGGYRGSLPLKVAYKRGHQLEQWVEVYPQTAVVNLPVVRDLPSRQLPVKVQLEGEPSAGFVVESVRVDPERVLVLAPLDILANLKSLESKPVNIAGANRTLSRRLEIDLPQEVIVGDARQLRAIITIVPASGEEQRTES